MLASELIPTSKTSTHSTPIVAMHSLSVWSMVQE